MVIPERMVNFILGGAFFFFGGRLAFSTFLLFAHVFFGLLCVVFLFRLIVLHLFFSTANVFFCQLREYFFVSTASVFCFQYRERFFFVAAVAAEDML